MSNPILSRILPAPRQGGFRMDDHFVWCGSVVPGEDGRFYMFASRWRRKIFCRGQRHGHQNEQE